MAGKKIFIEYDIDSSDLKIANGETLSLTQQLRILKKELQRGDIGEKQFEILRKKIGDTEDQIAKTTVRSKDFFGVLQSLPGPVGQFGSSILGVVDTLKVFSSFSFKDIKNSLSDVADDVKEITTNFLGLNKATKETAETNKTLSEDTKNTNESLAKQSSQAGATAAAIDRQKKSIQDLTRELRPATGQVIEHTKEGAKLVDQRDNMVAAMDANNQAVRNGTADLKSLNESTKTATKSTLGQTVVTNGLTLAQKAATFAVNALKLALASLGIGLVIIAVTKLVEIVGEYITGAKAAKAENERLTESYNTLKRAISDTQDAIKDQTELNLLQAKIAGESEEELFKITKEGFDKRVKANQEGRKKIERELTLLSANTILKEEDKLKKQEELTEELNKLGRKSYDLFIEGEKLRLNEELRIADKRRANQKTANEKALSDQK